MAAPRAPCWQRRPPRRRLRPRCPPWRAASCPCRGCSPARWRAWTPSRTARRVNGRPPRAQRQPPCCLSPRCLPCCPSRPAPATRPAAASTTTAQHPLRRPTLLRPRARERGGWKGSPDKACTCALSVACLPQTEVLPRETKAICMALRTRHGPYSDTFSSKYFEVLRSTKKIDIYVLFAVLRRTHARQGTRRGKRAPPPPAPPVGAEGCQ